MTKHYYSNSPQGLLIVNIPRDYTVKSREDLEKFLQTKFSWLIVIVCHADVIGIKAQFVGVM